ncbi:hydroxymethylbilane synthase [Thermosipho sp. (in: thermotogales)]|jgi:hydroxymethylbilane synthase|uniref:hydroxymethylbilane synthase n=1 Tax=Thermosipho sp. (in: thermotogales) TaxID=1968895 RepID=UPI00257F4A2B|nr:hydroxymethylbilane synthase [Thermosipho sp. (in: thermotogales)]MBZ4651039.1 hemC [Thermosipho sp. (in: thermotogales)]
MKIKVGTRGSKLALIQTNMVVERLKSKLSNVSFEVIPIKTKGDIVKKPVEKIGGKGVFVSDIEKLLLNGEIDIAIHSMKDMPSKIPDGLLLTSVLKREDARDVFVGKKDFFSLESGAKVGTSSKRRMLQLSILRPDIEIVPIRGNVDTRLKRIGELDGIVLAAAGLKRLGLEKKITNYFSIEQVVPAPCQGILALEFTSKFLPLFEKVKDEFVDPDTEYVSKIERKVLSISGFDCNTPFGFYCEKNDDQLIFHIFKNEKREKLVVDKDRAYEVLGEIRWE